MINQQSDFFEIKNQYCLPSNLTTGPHPGSSYALITKHGSKYINLLFYPINTIVNSHNIACPILFTANRAKTLAKFIQLHEGLFMQISSDHAFYLGIELMKAEFSLVINHEYIQD